MDSYEWNKIIGWILTAGIAVLGLSIVTGYIYPSAAPETKGYIVEGVELEATAADAGPAEVPIAMLLQTAQPARGEGQFKKCAACHTINKGGPNNQGPNLHGILGERIAAVAGFPYSAALTGHGGTWGFEELSTWLTSPRTYIPGNKMSFAGISNPKDRADLIAYLNSQSDNPLPLPAVTEAAEAGAVPETAVPVEQAAVDNAGN